MDIKFILFLLCLLGISFDTIHSSLGNEPYGTVKECSMDGINSNTVLALNYTPSKPSTPLTPDTCQYTHPEYSDLSCCDTAQSSILQQNMYIAGAIFGECPSCLFNIWDLWCASTCSPYQSSIMIPTSTESITVNGTVEEQIVSIVYVLNPTYASAVYNSCRDISNVGSPSFGDMYKTYSAFFNGIFGGTNNPAFNLKFIFDESGYNNTVVPCIDSCSCESCRDACNSSESSEELELNPKFRISVYK